MEQQKPMNSLKIKHSSVAGRHASEAAQ